MPIVLFDVEGRVIYFNEPAEEMFGSAFEETGEMPLEDWYDRFEMFDINGRIFELSERPVIIALRERRAAHAVFWAQRQGATRIQLEATAFPLEGQGGRHLGAVAAFWEARPE